MKKNSKLLIICCLWALWGNTLIDPTQPPGVAGPSAAQATSPLELTAIFVYPSKRIAIINGLRVTIGQRIGEYTVTSIDANTVELSGAHNTKVNLVLITEIKQGT